MLAEHYGVKNIRCDMIILNSTHIVCPNYFLCLILHYACATMLLLDHNKTPNSVICNTFQTKKVTQSASVEFASKKHELFFLFVF